MLGGCRKLSLLDMTVGLVTVCRPFCAGRGGIGYWLGTNRGVLKIIGLVLLEKACEGACVSGRIEEEKVG